VKYQVILKHESGGELELGFESDRLLREGLKVLGEVVAEAGFQAAMEELSKACAAEFAKGIRLTQPNK